MRNFIPAAVVSVGLMTSTAIPAQALFGVGDIVFDPSVFGQAVQQVKQGAEWLNNQMQELRNWTKSLDFMSDTLDEVGKVYSQAQSMYYAVNHITSIGGALSALSYFGIQNPLPINPYAVMSLANGTGSVQSMAYSIPSLFNTTHSANHVYDVTGYQGDMMRQRETSNAGMQAVSGQIYESMAQRLDHLRELQAKIDGADAKDLAALQVRISIEQSYVQTLSVQAQSVAMMQTSG